MQRWGTLESTAAIILAGVVFVNIANGEADTSTKYRRPHCFVADEISKWWRRRDVRGVYLKRLPSRHC